MVTVLAERPRPDDVAVSGDDAALRSRRTRLARRRLHAAAPRAAARCGARSGSALHQGRIAKPDQLVQGAWPVRGDHAREGARRHDRLCSDRRQRRQCHGRVRGTCGSGGAGIPASRREAAVPRRVHAVWRRGDTGRRPHFGRRPCGSRAWPFTRLVRRLHTEGAVPHRRQEDHGVRAGGTDGLAVPGLDHLSDRRRYGHGRDVESIRRARGDRVDGAAPSSTDGLGTGGWLCADRARVHGGTRSRGGLGECVDHRGWPSRPESDWRLPDSSRRARERRYGAGSAGSGDGRRHAADRADRGGQRRARGRRRACRHPAARSRRIRSAPPTPWCSSTLEGRSSTWKRCMDGRRGQGQGARGSAIGD